MGMYVCPRDRANVVAFLHGYEYSTAGECRFTKILGKHLAKKHRVKPEALGLPNQITRLAERRSLDWMEVYLLVSSEVLSAAVGSYEANAESAAGVDRGGRHRLVSARRPAGPRRC
jgi:hypothetical protein